MMSVIIIVSRLYITDMVNKIKINTNSIKLFHFEIYIIFSNLKVLSEYVIMVGNITGINIFITVRS